MWIEILCIEYILWGIPTIESTFDVANMVQTATVKDVPMNGLIERQLILGKSLYICYVDFSKAFDLINRHILFYKIINLGWHGKVINALRYLYSKTYFRVKCNGEISSHILDTLGVNQGGNASGFLFRKYMADLSHYLHREFAVVVDNKITADMLWADDLVHLVIMNIASLSMSYIDKY